MKNEQNEENNIFFKINNKLSSKKDENLFSIFHIKYILSSTFILLFFLVILFGLNQFKENNIRYNSKYKLIKKNLRKLNANLRKLYNLYQSNLNNISDDDHCEII